MFAEIRALPPADAIRRMQVIYTEPIKPELVISRALQRLRLRCHCRCCPLRAHAGTVHKTVVEAGVDLFVIRGTTVSAEHRPKNREPLNLRSSFTSLMCPWIGGG
jgi:IMP dehydrogenase